LGFFSSGSSTCCFTTYANGCWRLDGRFPSLWVSSHCYWMCSTNAHSCSLKDLWSKACCLFSWQLPWSSSWTISPWTSSSYGYQAGYFCWITGSFSHIRYASNSDTFRVKNFPSLMVFLLHCSMLHCFLRHPYDRSAALHIVTLHSRSNTTSALQR
jgi:hypothetical protein